MKPTQPQSKSATRRILKEVTRRILPSKVKSAQGSESRTTNHESRSLWIFTSAASGILLALSFPGWNLDALAWMALMPLLYGILRFPESALRQGFIAGVVFYWATLFWLHHVTIAGWLLLGTYLALYVALWAWGMARFRVLFPENSGAHHLRLAAFGAVSWVALEWIRGHFISGGFPWNPLGVSQFRNIAIIQISEITGIYGVSALIVFFNVAVFCGIRRMVLEKFSMARWRYEITASLFVLVAVMVWGMRSFTEISRAIPAETIKIGLIQPNVPQTLKWVEEYEQQARRDLKALTIDAALLKPDLIVWPETALTTGPSYDGESAELLQKLMDQVKTTLIIGTVERDPFKKFYYNTALFLNSDGSAAPPYHKRNLVPFGEFVPMADTFPILRKLTPIGVDFGAGTGAQLFQDKHRAVRIGMLICFEDVFTGPARESAQAGANVLINITNDGWFKESDEQMQHAAHAVFRAVENRLPLARCCNNGYTCVIDPTGRISASLEDASHNFYIRGMKVTEMNLFDRPQAFYTRYGDVFAMLCITLTGLVWAMWGWQALASRRTAGKTSF